MDDPDDMAGGPLLRFPRPARPVCGAAERTLGLEAGGAALLRRRAVFRILVSTRAPRAPRLGLVFYSLLVRQPGLALLDAARRQLAARALAGAPASRFF